jgi:hypothetical protein
MTGTVNWLNARTNVSIAANPTAPRAAGHSTHRINTPPRSRGSLSSWAGSTWPMAPRISNVLSGHRREVSTRIVPASENSGMGSQERSSPFAPNRSSQLFTTRNGGNARATSVPSNKPRRVRPEIAASRRATRKPSPTPSTVLVPETSKLFFIKIQFTA